jgi:hypothetical protein
VRDIGSYQSRLERLPIREQEMAAVSRDYEITKANYRALLDKKISAGMATEMERRQKSERFTMLDPARVPEKPFKPNRHVLTAVTCFAGFGLAAALAFGRELKKGFLLGEWELPAGIPILCRVPWIELGIPAPEEGTPEPTSAPPRSRQWRFALVSSAVLSLLVALAAAGYYLKWIRF